MEAWIKRICCVGRRIQRLETHTFFTMLLSHVKLCFYNEIRPAGFCISAVRGRQYQEVNDRVRESTVRRLLGKDIGQKPTWYCQCGCRDRPKAKMLFTTKSGIRLKGCLLSAGDKRSSQYTLGSGKHTRACLQTHPSFLRLVVETNCAGATYAYSMDILT